MPDLYEFEITGAIGPLVESCLAGFSATSEPSRTVLTGTVDGPDSLRRVLDLLAAHGTPAVDVRIHPHHDGPGSPAGTGLEG